MARPAPTHPVLTGDMLGQLQALGYTLHQNARALAIVPPVCAVAGGDSLMGGDPRQDATSLSGERPAHLVRLPTFEMARFPLTVAEYACFVRAGRRAPHGWWRQRRRPLHPVVGVTWHDLMAYAAWLMSVTRQPWRLPTEAEWEKAARWDAASGAARVYPWGNRFEAGRCNSKSAGPGRTAPVGNYPSGASAYGVEEMAGTVWEWTSSAFWPYPYNAYDGRELAFVSQPRVLRGGSWFSDGWLVRASYRVRGFPWHASDIIGGRLVLGLPGGSEPATIHASSTMA